MRVRMRRKTKKKLKKEVGEKKEKDEEDAWKEEELRGAAEEHLRQHL